MKPSKPWPRSAIYQLHLQEQHEAYCASLYQPGDGFRAMALTLRRMPWRLIMLALLILFLCQGQAADIVDLGVITPDRYIQLEKCERRKDFGLFKVEIIPRNLRGWTNKVTFTTTNDVITMEDLAAVPDGLAVMGVRQICADSSVSPVAIFKIDVQRDPPDAPKATVVGILRNRGEQKIEHVLDAIQNRPSPEPPMPQGMTNAPQHVPTRTTTTTVTKPEAAYYPLPGGIGETYSQYQARLEKRLRSGQRLKNER